MLALEFSYEPTANEAGLQNYKFQCSSSGTWKGFAHMFLIAYQL